MIKVYDIPDNGIGGRGRHYRNIFEDLEDTVVEPLSVPDLESEETSLAGGGVPAPGAAIIRRGTIASVLAVPAAKTL